MFDNDEILRDLQVAIGEKIRARRKQFALSMDELTALSGIDSSTISRAETASSQITLDTAIRISRALQLPLTELVPVETFRSQSRSEASAKSATVPITDQDVSTLLEIYRSDREVAENLMVTWLNRLAAQIPADNQDQVPIDFRDANIQLLLIRHDLFQFKIKLPGNTALYAVPAIYRHGGDIGHGEIQLLLTAISDDNHLFQKLDRQCKDVLRRLQSNTPDRVRVSDLLKLESVLNFDLLGMLACAEQVSTRDFESNSTSWGKTRLEARLVSLFIIIAYWFEQLYLGASDWITTIRTELISALHQHSAA